MLTTAPSTRCVYEKCGNTATHTWSGEHCFRFCDDHWPHAKHTLDHPTLAGTPTAIEFNILKDRAIAMLRAGHRPTDIGRILGLNERNIYRWRENLDRPTKDYSRLDDKEVERAKQLHEQGNTYAEIAEILGRSRTGIYYRLKLAKTPTKEKP